MHEPLPFLRPLPDGRQISAVSFGCSSVWANPKFPEEKARAIFDAAVAAGINYFDSGPSYGGGLGERRLGRFIAEHSESRLLISTKVGTYMDQRGHRRRSFKVADMEKSLEDSLHRLGVGCVDILYLHGPQMADLNEDVLEFLYREKRRGRFIWSGVNSFDPAILKCCVDLPIDAVMLQYNLVDQSAGVLLPRFHAAGKIVVSGTALARAIYAPTVFIPTSWERAWYLLRALKSDPLFLLKGSLLQRKFKEINDVGPRAAIRYVVGNQFIHTATFGTSQVEHLIGNVEAGRDPMPDDHRRVFDA